LHKEYQSINHNDIIFLDDKMETIKTQLLNFTGTQSYA